MTDLLVAHHNQFVKNLSLIGMESPGFEFFSNALENPFRYYHGMQHIADLRLLHGKLFKQAKGMTARESIFVELAIWWHDFIYDPRNNSGVNEYMSANLFELYGKSEALKGYANLNKKHEFAITLEEVANISGTISSTIHGETPYIRLPWSLYMLDLDLAGIGADWEKFNTNTHNIKKEYMAFGIKESTFVRGRIKFWEGMKQRGGLYYNPYNLDFYKQAEIQAKDNINRELNLLNQELSQFNH